MKGTSVPNKKSTTPKKQRVVVKHKTPIKGKLASMYHATRGGTAPKLTTPKRNQY